MDLQPNRYGKYKKDDIIAAGYEIYDYGYTYSELKEEGFTLNEKERIELIDGFKTGKGYRGYVPVYDILKVGSYMNNKREKEE